MTQYQKAIRYTGSTPSPRRISIFRGVILCRYIANPICFGGFARSLLEHRLRMILILSIRPIQHVFRNQDLYLARPY